MKQTCSCSCVLGAQHKTCHTGLDALQWGCCCNSIQKMVLGSSFGKVLGAFQHFGSVTDSLLHYFSYCLLYSASLPLNRQVLDDTCHQAGTEGVYLRVSQGQHPGSSCRKRCRGGCLSKVTAKVLVWLSASCWLICLYNIFLFLGIHYPLLFQFVKAIYINLSATELS